MFTWVQLSLKLLSSIQQKLYLLVDSIDHSSILFPLVLGKEWNEVMGRENLGDFQMIWYVLKTCDCLGVKQNIKKWKSRSHKGTQNF